MTVMAISEAKNNAELIAECAELGYLHEDWPTLDPTYGLGRFWSKWEPIDLVASDLDVTKSPCAEPIDFAYLPWPARTFRAVVFDPPYKLNGTSTGTGGATCDEDYGVATYDTIEGRHDLIRRGIDECIRVLAPGRNADRSTGGYLLVKCQDQVSSGRVQWQSRIFADHAERHDGVRLVDMLHLPSYRAQPAGSRQLHARRNYSTLLVFRKTA